MSLNKNIVEAIYKKAIEKYKEYNFSDGMAIFYTPLKKNPELLIIGDNPGGQNGLVWLTYPDKHDYFLDKEDDYDLAKKMRLIFGSKEMIGILKDSVKINRVFFQSKDIDDLKSKRLWREMEKWCGYHVREIIFEINPKIIFAESIGSYKSILGMIGGKHIKNLIVINNKAILRYGASNQFIVFGIYHPSSRWSKWIKDNDWMNLSIKLEENIFNDQK